MWTALACLLAAGLVLQHLWWRRRGRHWERDAALWRQEVQVVKEQGRQALTQEQARQAALLNNMVEGVLVCDALGHVRWINRSLEQALELSPDLEGRSLMQAFRLHELQALAQRTATEGQVLGFELDVPGRVPRRFEINATAWQDQAGQPHGVILVFHEVTRLKQLETTRQEFVANVSHELRTPLSIIKGNVETLLDGAKDDPVMAGRFLQAIRKHADRLTFLIEDLLTISSLESGRLTLQLKPTSVHRLVAQVLEDLAARAAERQIQLENRIPEDMVAQADAERLQQVFANLIDNALKYGRAGGHVVVAGKLDGADSLEFCVQDDGPGIPAEARERVFERFYRVDRARSREMGGTGLGLAIVKHIVQSHGGRVWVRSEPGRGASFFFTLRPGESPADAKRSEADSPADP